MNTFETVLLTLVILWRASTGIFMAITPVDDESARADPGIEQLIRDLASSDFTVREKATRQLVERGDAVPALRQALHSGDAEVVRRARSVLDVLAQREKERALARLVKLAKEGAVDLAIEQFVQRKTWDDEAACWQVFAELAGKLTELEEKLCGRASLKKSEGVPARDFKRYVEKQRPQFAVGGKLTPRQTPLTHRIVVRAEVIERDMNTYDSLIAVSGQIRAISVSRSVIVAGGSIEVSSSDSSIFVCDGDFKERSRLDNCLVIARGNVKCDQDVTNCRIFAGGRCSLGAGARSIGSLVTENETNPLGFVKFFNPGQIGITVENRDVGLRVNNTPRDKAFGLAGIRRGDVILALDGKELNDAEAFRRLLRPKLFENQNTLFRVRRAKATFEIKVRLPPDLAMSGADQKTNGP